MSIATTRRARRGMHREWRLHALSVFSLAVAFVCLGAALLVLTNLKSLEERWSHAGRVSVYLKDNAAPQDVESLKAVLGTLPIVTGVRYVSAGQARADFAVQEDGVKGQLAGLPVEAFPSSLELEVKPDVADADLADVVGKLKQLPAVDDVETYQTWTERLSRLIRGGVAAAGLLALVVFAAVLAVVGSTIRLALQRRRTEVEVLRLVGATDGFIKGPFLVEGSAQGAVGASCAIALLAALFFLVRGKLDVELANLVGVEPHFLPWWAVLGMILTDTLLGMIAAAFGLRRLVTV